MTDSIPMLLWCPQCNARHIDKGEFATKIHHTHACQNCGHCWRPAVVATTGVQFLPGFKDGEHKSENEFVAVPNQDRKITIHFPQNIQPGNFYDVLDIDKYNHLLNSCLIAAGVDPSPQNSPKQIPMIIAEAFQDLIDDKNHYKQLCEDSSKTISDYNEKFDKIIKSKRLDDVGTYFLVEKDGFERAKVFMDKCENEMEDISAIGGRFEWCFVRTSVGTAVKIKDVITKKELDLSDYENW